MMGVADESEVVVLREGAAGRAGVASEVGVPVIDFASKSNPHSLTPRRCDNSLSFIHRSCVLGFQPIDAMLPDKYSRNAERGKGYFTKLPISQYTATTTHGNCLSP